MVLDPFYEFNKTFKISKLFIKVIFIQKRKKKNGKNEHYNTFAFASFFGQFFALSSVWINI